MNPKRIIFFAGLAAVVAGVIMAGILASRPSRAPVKTDHNQISAARPAPGISLAPKPSLSVKESSPVETSPALKANATSKNSKQPGSPPTAQTMTINGYQVQDPMARMALSFVGADPDAEAYWASAINDSAVPAEERKDLIEDLNEDGLSDPHHPSADNMPLIMSRMQLIEELAPYAMDDVNRKAFAEAYKDLNGLLHGQEPQ